VQAILHDVAMAAQQGVGESADALLNPTPSCGDSWNPLDHGKTRAVQQHHHAGDSTNDEDGTPDYLLNRTAAPHTHTHTRRVQGTPDLISLPRMSELTII
jgi:hypothetical protein